MAAAEEAFFTGWTPAEMLTVVVVREKQINRGEDADWLVGVRTMSLPRLCCNVRQMWLTGQEL